MTDATPGRPLFRRVLFAALISIASGSPALAQDRPAPVVEVAAGWTGFPDDGAVVSEGLVGGAFRWYLHPRISVGPEIVYISGDNHRHLVVTGNITWDLLSQVGRGPRPITPFLTVGGGVFQTRGTFFRGTVTSSEGAFTAGGGVRAAVADRVTLGVEARIGWETHIRLNGLVGVRLWE